ncbi:7-carboxy-7-deazaguanine synthase [Bacteroidales bacterium]|nr:7-carboxy-7-deazaguanine synthase [Bacteroidales bacterium]
MTKGISEIYPCIQGEGSRVGVPSILIRSLGCNLRCSWCDTPFTSWHVEKGSYTNQDVAPVLESNPQIKEVIISGGEPCIYPGLEDLINICSSKNKLITLETNGTLLIAENAMKMIDLVSISPKLSNSTPDDTHWKEKHENTRINTESIQKWMMMAKSYQLKFVVSHPNDITEIKQVLDILKANNRNVYLMPEGTCEKELQGKRKMLADICIREGFCYCERVHIVIYGNKRGV